MILEREEGRENVRERTERQKERNIYQLPPVRIPTGDRTLNLGMCPDRELNLQPFGVWDDAPINRATWPGLNRFFFFKPGMYVSQQIQLTDIFTR